jgi:hypothetical protein
MNRINLAKYGFVRCPSADFSDDGNRFTCYRAGNSVRVSKLVSDGQVYLSADSDCNKGTLPYEIYSKLPHYNDSSWKWNGVSVATLTEQDLIDFYNACVLYEQEYEEAVAKLVYPSLEDLQKKSMELYLHLMTEVKEVDKLFGKYALEAATKLSPYEWEACQKYIKSLVREMNAVDPTEYPQKILNTVASFSFVKRVPKESFYYSQIKEMFGRYCMSV